jgi:L-asparaginase
MNENPMNPHLHDLTLHARHVVVLATGGTIAGLADKADAKGGGLGGGQATGGAYTAAQLSIQQLLTHSGIAQQSVYQELVDAGVCLELEQVAQVDSKDITEAIWLALAQRVAHHVQRPEVVGVVVTHGTDTLEETSVFLQRLLDPQKPVVLTAAMRPADALMADGPQNLMDAMVVAASGLRGVLLVMNGKVWGGAEVRKWHPWQLDAFMGAAAGPVASVHQGRLSVFRPYAGFADAVWVQMEGQMGVQASGWAKPLGLGVLPEVVEDWPWVEVVASHAASSARALQCLVQAGVDGVILSATGNGTLHQCLVQLLGDYIAQGRLSLGQVLVATRCGGGGIVGQPSHGLPTAAYLTPAQARVMLMLNLCYKRLD